MAADPNASSLAVDQNTTYVVYDGECPFCSRYIRFLRIRQAIGSVELIDGRTSHPVVGRITAAGVNLDEGMALVHGSQVYLGAECIHRLALMSTDVNWFNRLNAIVFRSSGASRLLYPLLRAGRNLTLALLGRRKITS